MDDDVTSPSGRKIRKPRRPRKERETGSSGGGGGGAAPAAATAERSSTIDRFEGDWAVVMDDQGRQVNIRRSQLPAGAKPGDVLGPGPDFKIDHEATRKLAADTAAEQQKLAGDKGADIKIGNETAPENMLSPAEAGELSQAHHRPKPTLRIDPNTAPQAVIEALPGVGPAVAGRWIQEREKKPFDSLDDLRKRVKGLGPVLWSRISIHLREPTKNLTQGPHQHQPGPWDEQPGLVREALGLSPKGKGPSDLHSPQYPPLPQDSRGPETSLANDSKLQPLTEDELTSTPPVPQTKGASQPFAETASPQSQDDNNKKWKGGATPTLQEVFDVPILNAIRRITIETLEHIGFHSVPPINETSNNTKRTIEVLTARVDLLTEQVRQLNGATTFLTQGPRANTRTSLNMGSP